MKRSGYIKRAAALAAVLFALSFSGCGNEEVDAYASKVLKLTITPAPSPTPAPVVKYPEATASKDGITMVNSYLAAASDGINPYAGKAAEVNASPDESELPEEQTEETAEAAETDETADTQSSGSSIASYYESESTEDGSAGYDESYDYDSGYYDSSYDEGYYDNSYDYDSGYYDDSYDYDSGYYDYNYDYNYDYGY